MQTIKTKLIPILISLLIISSGYFAYKTYSLQKQIKQHTNGILIIGNFVDKATNGQLSAFVKELQTNQKKQ